jgi:hypothetical protein
MDVAKIQREVRRRPARERKKLTAWKAVEFPAPSVDRLMAKAAQAVKAGTFKPTPPTADNFSEGRALERALAGAGQQGLRRQETR